MSGPEAADRATAEALLDAALAAGAHAADVLVAASTALEVGVAERALEDAERSESVDIGLRVLIGQRQACVSASERSADVLAETAARAVAVAREAPDDPHCGLAEPDALARDAEAAERALDLADAAASPDPAALEALAREAEDAALAIEGVGQVEQARASWSTDRVTLAASNGLRHQTARTTWAISASAIAGEGLGRERDYAVEIRRHRSDLPAASVIGQRAGERAVAALGARRPPTGPVPVLYDERVAASLIGHLLSAINGQSVARGSSWAADLMDQAVLPAGIDVFDDPTIARGRASRAIDAEGLAARRRPLVEQGRLVSWVLDLATGRQLGLGTTGNARRGTGGPPRPGTSNIRMTLGDRDRAGLIREMGRGLLVTGLIGSSINPTTGAYSRGANGFWVEGGEITHPVNEITIAGNLQQMLTTVTAGNDADLSKGMAVPSLLVEGLTVGA
ncbi:MAG: metallopeptidase TldD-related protein [Pseudomonadota bacterium]